VVSGDPPVLAFVGSVTPDDEASMRNPAWSPAGCRFQLGLLEGLSAAGVPPDLILSQEPARRLGRSARLLKLPGRVTLAPGMEGRWIPYLNLPLLRRLSAGLSVMARLWVWGRRTRRAGERAVLAFNLTDPPAWGVLAGARLAGAMSVGVVADVNVPGGVVPRGWRWRFDHWLACRLIRRFDRLITVREETASDLAPGIPHMVVPGGVSSWALHRADTAGERPPRPHAGRFTMVLAGMLTAYNGIPLMLEAMGLTEGEGFRLRVAGRGPLEQAVREAAARDPRIEYCGFLGREQVALLYEESDLLLNIRIAQAIDTSRFFPSKFIEFLATGRPVLTTAFGPAGSQYAGLAFVLEGETAADLAGAVRRLAGMTAAEREARGEAARRYVREHLTWEAQGGRIRRFLETGIGPAEGDS
jgi:glycosyltransferase involved in cell wall biosynthesis